MTLSAAWYDDLAIRAVTSFNELWDLELLKSLLTWDSISIIGVLTSAATIETAVCFDHDLRKNEYLNTRQRSSLLC